MMHLTVMPLQTPNLCEQKLLIVALLGSGIHVRIWKVHITQKKLFFPNTRNSSVGLQKYGTTVIKDVSATPTFTRKRLFDAASGSTEHDAPSKKRTPSKDKDSPLDTLRNRPQSPLDTAEKDLVSKEKE